MKGIIIIGYQGIGKSTLAGKGNCIDLESGCFYVGDKRHDDWYIPYCHVALALAEQGYTVFTSSHKPVVEFLKSVPLTPNIGIITVACPIRALKEQWINKLKERFARTGLWKDEKAFLNAQDRYEENIAELFDCDLPMLPIGTMDYDLKTMVDAAKNLWCKGD